MTCFGLVQINETHCFAVLQLPFGESEAEKGGIAQEKQCLFPK